MKTFTTLLLLAAFSLVKSTSPAADVVQKAPSSLELVLIVEFSGEREWSLLVGGVGHLLANNYDSLLKCVNSAATTAVRWRPRADLLQLARFQNDLQMAVHALESYTNAAAESPQLPVKREVV